MDTNLYPETVVLAIMTHGGYDLDEERRIAEFNLNEVTDEEDNTLRTVTAAPVGVTFYHDEEMNPTYIETIQTVFAEYRAHIQNRGLKQHELDRITDKMSKKLKKIDDSRVKTYETSVRNDKKLKHVSSEEMEEIKEMGEFAIFQKPKMFWTKTYENTGRTMIPNKEFTVKTATILYEDDYYNKINMINVSGVPNLMDAPGINVRAERNSNHLFMSDLLAFLYSNGVKHIIIVDFSCSNVGFKSDNVTDRELRILRRSSHKKGWGKRKTQHKNKNKNKSFFTKRRRHKTRQNKNR